MAIHIHRAALYVGTNTGWSKSNLAMQKIIYIAHMLHLGNQNSPLVENFFEAWDYGPVHPDLYHKAKVFGADNVKNIFRTYDDLDDSLPETKTLKDTLERISNYSGAQLVAITHCDYGAWHKNYIPGKRYTVISNSDIREEFKERVKRSQSQK